MKSSIRTIEAADGRKVSLSLLDMNLQPPSRTQVHLEFEPGCRVAVQLGDLEAAIRDLRASLS